MLIDSFIVPEESNAEFIQQAYQSQAIVKTLPGFVEGYIYEYQTGDSPYYRRLRKFRVTCKRQAARCADDPLYNRHPY